MAIKLIFYGLLIIHLYTGVSCDILEELKASSNKYTPCCAELPNIIENKKCINKSENDFKCEHGKYAIHETELKFKNGSIYINTYDDNWEGFTSDYCLTTIRNKGIEEISALVCFPDYETEYLQGQFSITNPRIIISIISVIFALLTFLVYCLVPDLRDLQGKCIMSFLICLSVGYTWLTINQLNVLDNESPFVCYMEAFMLYFWMIATFFWLNVICINVWRNVRLHHITISDPTMFKIFNFYAWGMTALMFLILIVAHHTPSDFLNPNIGVTTCWLSGDLESWTFFYGPILCLLIINTILFIITGLYLWSDYSGLAPTSKIVSHRYKCLLYLKIFIVMGVTWLCEPISFLVDTVKEDPKEEYILLNIVDYINLLQGVFIFIILVLTRKRALRGLARTEICGYRLAPASCATMERLEEDFDEILENDLERNVNNTIISAEIK
ncbi:G-protein coupled receptor Mth2-like [Chrysoperla carnea]|uniref:G-protein coupled receptor Mth2-like n=1 Tax=Chrysoperla carnea TaxID=189513 RepID=UPI001D060A82|nr:G-protein coupled receptor Mth2-like [Chrysoperla carnea]